MAPNTTAQYPDLSPPPDKGKVKEILFDGYYYDVTDWVNRHPGGKVIDYYTKLGEDATVAITQFHYRSSVKVAGIMKSFKRRPANDLEIGLDQQTLRRHRALTEDFTKLHLQLEAQGFFKPSRWHVAYRLSELLILASLGIYLISFDSLTSKIIGTLTFALYMGRCGWLQHESGHLSLTGHSKMDRVITAIVMGLGDGLSSSCWFSQHQRHHAMPQRVKRDVDLETLPLVAFNASLVKHSGQGKNFFVRHQALLYLIFDTLLVGLLWKLYLHPRYVIFKKKYFELSLMILTNGVAYWIGFWPYFFAIWLTLIYMLGNFTLSHTHLPVTSRSLHWVEYGFLHTMDIEPSWWCNFWMGWLNFQIEHHLFPAMPQFRHPKIKDKVKDFAEKHNLPYRCVSYWQAWRLTLENLYNVSKELQKLH